MNGEKLAVFHIYIIIYNLRKKNNSNMKNIRTFEGFTGKYNTSEENERIVVDKKVKDILGKIFNKELRPKYTDLDSCKELVDEFIKYAEFKDLKDEKGVSETTLPRLLKKFDSKVKKVVLDDITSHFKKLNGDDIRIKYTTKKL